MGPSATVASHEDFQQTDRSRVWAELYTLDLSALDSPESIETLASSLIEACRTVGYFKVKGFGIPREKIEEQFKIMQTFYDLPLQEKEKCTEMTQIARVEGSIDKATGLRDRIEIYCIPRFQGEVAQSHPAPVSDNLGEVEAFVKDVHRNVLEPLFTLLAIGLHLPANYFLDMHPYEQVSEDQLRSMKCGKYLADEIEHIDDLWTPAHANHGSLVLLFGQTSPGLQIKDARGEWAWVKPQEDAIVVSTCDALSLVTAGRLKSNVHRVAILPKGYEHVDRLALLYHSFAPKGPALSTIDHPC